MRTEDDMIPPEVERELDAIEAALAGRPVEPELTELGRLALELREERTEIDPFFARELDAKVAAGFPRARRWPRFTGVVRTLMPVAALLLVPLVVAIGVISSSPQFGSDDEEGASGGGRSAPQVAEDDPGGGGSGAASAGSDEAAPSAPSRGALKRNSAPSSAAVGDAVSSPPAPGGGSVRGDRRSRRLVEQAASLTLVAEPARIDDVADGIIRVTDAVGGFVVSSTVESTDGGGGGLFELRVPSARLQRALAELSKLGHVGSRQESSQDITAQGVSARERLSDARAERRSLLRQLERADTTAEIDALRARLRDASARIAAAKTDLARVRNRAQYSNISVSLTADPDASEADDEGTWTPGDAFHDALRVLEVIAGVALIALAVLLPMAALLALLWPAARWNARRRRERILDAV